MKILAGTFFITRFAPLCLCESFQFANGQGIAKIRGMKQSIFAFSALLFGSLFAFAAPPPPAESAPAATEQKSEEIDLMAMNRDARCGQILITCLVNGQPMRMMLDTGATHTVLHHTSADKIKNARWLDTSKMKFKSNSVQRPKILIADLQVGPGTAPQHAVIVVSLDAVRGMLNEKIDGIVGMDILGSLPFTFDLKNKQYYWGAPEKAKLTPLAGKEDPNGRLLMQVKSGKQDFHLLLDTGSSVTRIFKGHWAPGAAGEISAQIGDVDKASSQKLITGKPGHLEVAPGVFLKNITPILSDTEKLTMIGMDAFADSALVHLPTEDSPFGKFYLAGNKRQKD